MLAESGPGFMSILDVRKAGDLPDEVIHDRGMRDTELRWSLGKLALASYCGHAHT